MTKTHETTRVIHGRRCRCIDVGCPDFDQAETNRFFITNKLDIEGYLEMEEAIRGIPIGGLLPKRLRGRLINVGRDSLRVLKHQGYHDTEDTET